MPGTPASYHFMPNHRYERYYDAFAAAPPSIAFILDPSKDDYLRVRSKAPNAKMILRSYEWSDGGLDVLHRIARDPVGTGTWMAQKWLERIREWGVIDLNNTWFTGSNEYTVIPGMPIPPFVIAERTFAEVLGRGGAKPCICNLGVGHPAETKDGKVDWTPFLSWEKVLQDTDGILGLHEYWRGETGPRMNVKPQDEAKGLFWYAWRFMQCPMDVRIAITECGIDQKVDAPPGTPSKGWVGTVEANVYAGQMAEYNNKAVEDPRYVGEVAFCHDYPEKEWATYDSDRALNELITVAKSLKPVRWYTPGAGVKPPVPGPIPPVSRGVGLPLPVKSYYITDHFDLDSNEIHQGIDLGALVGTPVLSVADGEVAYVGDHRQEEPKPPNGGYGKYIRVWHGMHSFHSFYAHMDTQYVKAGDKVTVGQKLGTVGNTGNSTGPHLHLEIRYADLNGVYIPQTPFLNGRVDPETALSRFGLSIKDGAVQKGFLSQKPE